MIEHRMAIYNEIEQSVQEGQEKRGKSFGHDDATWATIMVDYLGRACRRIFSGEGVRRDDLIKALAVGVSWLAIRKYEKEINEVQIDQRT